MNTNNNNRRRSGSRPKTKSFRNKKTIAPANFIKQARPVETIEFQAPHNFGDLKLHQDLKRAIESKGYVAPTEIQSKSIHHLVEGKDIVGIANTGTGKTGAFLIPIIHQLLTFDKTFQTLVVLPTRELALQVEEEFKSLTKGLNFYSSTLIGGTSVQKDLSKLKRQNHLIIGTPGRIMDMMEQKALNLQKFSILVLDEFDRMLDMGFVRDVEKITSAMPNRRQTMLFSATIEKGQDKIIEKLVNNPVKISVSSGTCSSDAVEQDIIELKGRNKYDTFTELIKNDEFNKVLVFAETKRVVNQLNKKLIKSGFRSDMIHGDKSQNYRVTALRKFKTGRVNILVATDVAARGIDISDITHVINYQAPTTMDSYIHRIGRTGRAGKKGHAYTFID